MANTTIEINGFKLTPEFMELIDNKFFSPSFPLESFRDNLFDVQSAVLIAAGNEEVSPEQVSNISFGLSELESFVRKLLALRKEGKV